MPSYYSIIKYVPDQVSDEFVNIGAIVIEGEFTFFRFLKNWERAAAFTGTPAKDIARIATEFEKDCRFGFDMLKGQPCLTVDDLWELSRLMTNSVQVTEPRASTGDRQWCMSIVAKRFLVDVPPASSPLMYATGEG